MCNAPLVVILCRDAMTRLMLRFLLLDEGCEVVEMSDAAAVVTMPRREEVNLLVVAGEPKEDIGSTLALLHRSGVHLVTALLTRGADLQVRQRAFGLGVLDVVSLPANPRDIQARLRAVLRDPARHAPAHTATEVLRAGGLRFQTRTREVSDGTGWHVHLTRREAALLRALMLAPGRAMGRQELLDHAWGENYEGAGNVLDVYVRRLRAKLSRPSVSHNYIRTVREYGYAFEARLRPRDEQDARGDGPPHVLVVEDHQPTALLLDEALRSDGYAVTCTYGAAALELARRLRPALILLDIAMPGMNGVEVRQRLREDAHTAHIPVIAISAACNLRAHLGEMGADDFLAKPFDIDELLLRVERWAGLPPAIVPPLPALAGGTL